MQDLYKALIPKTRSFLAGCAVGGFLATAAYVGHKIYVHKQHKSLYIQTFERISNKQYSTDKDINNMLHIIATIIEMSENGYLSTINDNVSTSDHQYPCCRMMTIKPKWKPPETLPFIYIGSNNLSRKYKQIKLNNKCVLTFGDEIGGGYVSLYGELIEINDQERLNKLYPDRWCAYPDGPDDPRFVIYKMNINKIEFVSHRFNYDSMRDDWKPFVLKRTQDSLQFNQAKWYFEDKAKKWRMDYSGYMVFDNEIQ